MKKYLFWVLIASALFLMLFLESKRQCPLSKSSPRQESTSLKEREEIKPLAEGLSLLKYRKDKEAAAIFEAILLKEPYNPDALWGKAEALRRQRDYQQAEESLTKILAQEPRHISALISLAYIRYKDDRLNEALKLIDNALDCQNINRENQALCYMMLGTINSRRSGKGTFLNKVIYGTRIKSYFLRAKELCPDLPEVRLGLGTFYLLAPAIVGGSLDKAIVELEETIKMAPDFATANARLAQAYRKKGFLDKCELYLKRAQELDPENEALQEMLKD